MENNQNGTTTLQLVLAWGFVGIPLVLTSTGLGLGERRREVGLLKALGWQTDEVVLRSLAECLTVTAIATGSSLLLVWLWVRVLSGALILRMFVPVDQHYGADFIQWANLPQHRAAFDPAKPKLSWGHLFFADASAIATASARRILLYRDPYDWVIARARFFLS